MTLDEFDVVKLSLAFGAKILKRFFLESHVGLLSRSLNLVGPQLAIKWT